MTKLDYDKKFYEQQRASNLSSAHVIVPIVLKILGKSKRDEFSVIDLGCGSGNWLSVFKKYGCKTMGVDGGDCPKTPERR